MPCRARPATDVAALAWQCMMESGCMCLEPRSANAAQVLHCCLLHGALALTAPLHPVHRHAFDGKSVSHGSAALPWLEAQRAQPDLFAALSCTI